MYIFPEHLHCEVALMHACCEQHTTLTQQRAASILCQLHLPSHQATCRTRVNMHDIHEPHEHEYVQVRTASRHNQQHIELYCGCRDLEVVVQDTMNGDMVQWETVISKNTSILKVRISVAEACKHRWKHDGLVPHLAIVFRVKQVTAVIRCVRGDCPRRQGPSRLLRTL